VRGPNTTSYGQIDWGKQRR